MEESDMFTDLSSAESDSETNHRKFSSASLFTTSTFPKSRTSIDTNFEDVPSANDEANIGGFENIAHQAPISQLATNTVSSHNRQRESLRTRLSSRSNKSVGMGKQGLDKLLTETYKDLDRLLEYTFILVEENNSLKEILKDAVIVNEDGNLTDYTDLLVNIEHDLPILSSLQYSPFSQSTPSPYTANLPQLHHSRKETVASPSDYSHASCDTIFHMSVDNESKPSTLMSDTVSLNMPLETGHGKSATDYTSSTSTIVEESKVSKEAVATSFHSGGSCNTVEFHSPVSLPRPVIAENSLEATASLSNAVDSFTRESRIAITIKNLHSLTISNSCTGSKGDKLPQEKKRSSSQEGSPKKSPRFSSFRKKNKKEDASSTEPDSNSTAVNLQDSALPVSDKQISFSDKQVSFSDKQASISDKQTSVSLKQVSTGKSEDGEVANKNVPKFFTSDMMSIIAERNELKEKVLQLNDKIKDMESQSEGTYDHNNTNLGEVDLLQMRGFRKNTLLRTSKTLCECDRYIRNVVVIGYKKISKAYVYVIHTTWSDRQRFEIYRRYGEFFTFHGRLLHLFPIEAGKNKASERVLPSLPTIDNVLSLFGRTNNESFVKQRLDNINDYCKTLLLELDCQITKNVFVVSFFRPVPGDRQLQSLPRPRSKSEMSMSILSVYPQNLPTGSEFEEYVSLADYESKAEGELSVKVGEIVKVINREATGWWLVCKTDDNSGSELSVGYVPGDFLKRQGRPGDNLTQTETLLDIQKKYLGFVSSAALTKDALQEIDSMWKYVAIEDYSSADPRQISFKEGAELIVVEKSEDGWWLVALDGNQGWAPASFLEPQDRRAFPEGEKLVLSLDNLPAIPISSEKYVAKAAFKGLVEDDISFPDKATIEVIEKSISGWWMVRYNGRLGMAPASMLALTAAHLDIPKEYQFALTVDLGHGTSGIIEPPPRSKRFILQSQHRPRSNTNTEEVKVDTIFEDGQFLTSSSSDSEDEGGYKDKHGAMSKHVRKHVITDEGRKDFRMRFKSFVKPESVKYKPCKQLTDFERRGTAPAIFFKGKGRPKKLLLQRMDVLVDSLQSSTDSPLTEQNTTKEAAPMCKSISSDDKLALMSSLSRGSRNDEDQQLPLYSTSDESVSLKPHTCSTDGNAVNVQSMSEEKATLPQTSVQTVPTDDEQDRYDTQQINHKQRVSDELHIPVNGFEKQ